MAESPATEIRCPTEYRRMFGKLVRRGEDVTVVENLLEFSCRSCTKEQKAADPAIVRVVHRYNIAGELIETAVCR